MNAAAGKSFADRQIGLVTIRRRKGRIAGFGVPRVPVQILWCGSNRPRKKFGERRDGWSFPPAVRELLLQECQGETVLHLFGGRADFGYRLDMAIATDRSLPMARAWLVRVGDQCAARVLQVFEVREPKRPPLKPGEFTRGPALKYNRWQFVHPGLPFDEISRAAVDVGKYA